MLSISIIFLAILALGAQIKSQPIDQDRTNLGAIAQVVCGDEGGDPRQIGRSSTFGLLAIYLANLPEDHRFAECGAKYSLSLKKLAELVDMHNANVCGEEKIAAIRQFHGEFVSTLPKHLENRKDRNHLIPKLGEMFFMNYVANLSSACGHNMLA